MVIDDLLFVASERVKHRLWVASDLQQQHPERACYCMSRAADDFLSLHLPIEAVCYLGDAIEGSNLEFIHEMAQMQLQEFARIKAPKFYTIGNHDFDFFSAHQQRLSGMCIPFTEFMEGKPDWHVPNVVQRMYYIQDMGDYAMCFLTDHADPQGRWFTTHGEIRGDKDAYPYTREDYRHVMKEVASLRKPVLTFAHYSFAGGNRHAPLYDWFLPLPSNIRMHFYGHAHIGDAVWAGKDCHRKISGVDYQTIMQINVSSLENYRGSAIRSVIIEWYDTDEIGVLFRNHTLHCWDDYLIVRKGEGIRSQIEQHECH